MDDQHLIDHFDVSVINRFSGVEKSMYYIAYNALLKGDIEKESALIRGAVDDYREELRKHGVALSDEAAEEILRIHDPLYYDRKVKTLTKEKNLVFRNYENQLKSLEKQVKTREKEYDIALNSAQNSRWEYFVSSSFAINRTEGLVRVNDYVRPFSQILDVKLNEQYGQRYTSRTDSDSGSSRGFSLPGALFGALAGGPAGAVIGSVSGRTRESSTTRQTQSNEDLCRHLGIQVVFPDVITEIVCLSGDCILNSRAHRESFEAASKIYAELQKLAATPVPQIFPDIRDTEEVRNAAARLEEAKTALIGLQQSDEHLQEAERIDRKIALAAAKKKDEPASESESPILNSSTSQSTGSQSEPDTGFEADGWQEPENGETSESEAASSQPQQTLQEQLQEAYYYLGKAVYADCRNDLQSPYEKMMRIITELEQKLEAEQPPKIFAWKERKEDSDPDAEDLPELEASESIRNQ